MRPVGFILAARRDFGIAQHANRLQLAGAKFNRIPFLARRSPVYFWVRAAVRGGNGSDRERGKPARRSVEGGFDFRPMQVCVAPCRGLGCCERYFL
jgi:hypothetical protein